MNKLHFKHEAGQALILVVLAMPLLMSIAALVVDGTNLMVQRRQLQTAADAAALAGAQQLPAHQRARSCNQWSVQAPARLQLVGALQEYSGKNSGPATLNGGTCRRDRTRCRVASDTNCYTWPYNGDDTLVEVRLTESVSTHFTNAVDAVAPGDPLATAFTLSARAVAKRTPGAPPNLVQ